MKISHYNLKRASQLADTFDVVHFQCLQSSSASWIGTATDDKAHTIALWANLPARQAGSIGPQLGSELLSFLKRAQQYEVDRIVLFLDSAGVSLHQDWLGMQACADVIKALHRINIHKPTVTVAVLGQEIGCYGGALLIAGACQYQLASEEGSYGVSGSRVIAQLNHQTLPSEPFCYSAIYRILNGELSGEVPATVAELRKKLLAFPLQHLNLSRLRQRLDFLVEKSVEDNAALICCQHMATGVPLADATEDVVLGFTGERAVGCGALLAFCQQLLSAVEKNQRLPVIDGNAIQQFSLMNELRGFSACLSLTTALLRYIAELQPTLAVRVDKVGSGATFIAVALMADRLHIHSSARIYSLPPAVVERFTGKPAAESENGINVEIPARVGLNI